jgi:hypothetical protein
MLDSQPRNETMAELCSGEFNVAYCCDPEWKLPTLPPLTVEIIWCTGSLNWHSV